jgi:hypothetical protein
MGGQGFIVGPRRMEALTVIFTIAALDSIVSCEKNLNAIAGNTKKFRRKVRAAGPHPKSARDADSYFFMNCRVKLPLFVNILRIELCEYSDRMPPRTRYQAQNGLVLYVLKRNVPQRHLRPRSVPLSQ